MTLLIETKKRRDRPFFPLAFVIPFGILGAVAGCHTASVINTKVLSVLFGVLIATAGIVGFVKLMKKR